MYQVQSSHAVGSIYKKTVAPVAPEHDALQIAGEVAAIVSIFVLIVGFVVILQRIVVYYINEQEDWQSG